MLDLKLKVLRVVFPTSVHAFSSLDGTSGELGNMYPKGSGKIGPGGKKMVFEKWPRKTGPKLCLP